MRRQVAVSLLVSAVLGDEVKVFSADDKGAVHLSGDNGASQNSATDAIEIVSPAVLLFIPIGAPSSARCELRVLRILFSMRNASLEMIERTRPCR